MSRRQSLKRQKAFADAVSRAIREAGGVEVRAETTALGYYIAPAYRLQTCAGFATVSAAPSAFGGDAPGQAGGGQLYTTFEDVARANASSLPHSTLLNRFSGKWHHGLWSLDPEQAYERTVEILRLIVATEVA